MVWASACECSDGCSKVVAPEHPVCPDCGTGTVWLRTFPQGYGPGWLCVVCRLALFCIPGSSKGVVGVSGLFPDPASLRDCLRGQRDVLASQFPPGFL